MDSVFSPLPALHGQHGLHTGHGQPVQGQQGAVGGGAVLAPAPKLPFSPGEGLKDPVQLRLFLLVQLEADVAAEARVAPQLLTESCNGL